MLEVLDCATARCEHPPNTSHLHSQRDITHRAGVVLPAAAGLLHASLTFTAPGAAEDVYSGSEVDAWKRLPGHETHRQIPGTLKLYFHC
ncbi:hypothetical protein C0Q70_21535 [Pomacea canaliculata]|uniref:Uncharacterized protein n=1 Tax=Pomacea canaliculata TaxID=400727 RepID=A0A2T7NCS6_POMCA|nr:hypothetical protein C0Q70_21535 [Pomacea canaliculata]